MTATVLRGLRVAVTRARAQAEDLARPLREAGADVLIAPLIRIVPAADSPPVLEAVKAISHYDWLVFSSANGVEVFVEAMRGQGVTSAVFDTVKVACVGPATATAAERLGIRTDVMPDEFIGDAIAAALARSAPLDGSRILLARAHGARDVLPRQLRAAGAHVTDLELYRSDPDETGAALLRAGLLADAVDVVTFTSGSTVRYFTRLVGQPGRAIVAVIGPATAEVAVALGMRVAIEAGSHTTEGLVAAIIRYVAEAGGTGG